MPPAPNDPTTAGPRRVSNAPAWMTKQQSSDPKGENGTAPA
eukprot:CAMPEP_0194279016 /NCGR_PEP_ID=MMETSP0169-20130528/13023_1 /TAXON_ID=218684 /ORGANISM="Corethron pennatum, Strain L29A3" /LENGTH=40 /DNA_ID= /DNA_START= /DNA_END= /DNA_ORIENTATION=